MLEAMKEDMVINSVKCSKEVEKDEEGSGAGVRGHQDVIDDSDESCLRTVGGTQTSLEFFVQTV